MRRVCRNVVGGGSNGPWRGHPVISENYLKVCCGICRLAGTLGIRMRAVSNAVMAVLVVAALYGETAFRVLRFWLCNPTSRHMRAATTRNRRVRPARHKGCVIS